MVDPKQVFIEESDELLNSMEQALLTLDENGNDIELINDLFRSVHTIKGSAGVFSFDHLVSFTHLVENILDKTRSDPNLINEKLIGILLQCKDHIKNLVQLAISDKPLDDILNSQEQFLRTELEHYSDFQDPDSASEELLEEISEDDDTETVSSDNWHISLRFDQEILKHGMDPHSVFNYLAKIGEISQLTTIHENLPEIDSFDPELCYLGVEIALKSDENRQTIDNAFEFIKDLCQIHIAPPHAYLKHYAEIIRNLPETNKRIGEILVASGSLSQEELDRALHIQNNPHSATSDGNGQKLIGEILLENNATHPELLDTALKKQSKEHETSVVKQRVLRVDADKLDKLINLVGELVIAGANSNLLANQLGNEQLSESMSGLNQLVEKIRDHSLGLRMVQIGETFNHYKRLVRDISKELDKDIQLVISGAETEIDKTVAESLADPLLHLIRNAIDHGIEPAEERITNGKPAQGHVYLNAYHDSGNIVIDVADDGRGLSKTKIIKKAHERKLIPDNHALTDQEIYRLILEAGFSTADHVTNLSGRGVGMDVVKRNIESLRGSLDIDSVSGKGTKISLRAPLTLAIIDGFLVRVGPSFYVVPLDLVHECIEYSEDAESVDGLYGYISLRGEVLPFLRLSELYDEKSSENTRESILVVRNGDQKVGFVVDELAGEYQTVIKPIGSIFNKLDGVSGATILGSGAVAVILDVPRLVQYAIDQINSVSLKSNSNNQYPLH